MKFLLLLLITSLSITAQQSSFQDTLLDKLTGQWVMTGQIAGQEITHDLNISWVLEHQYIQITEKSREKDPDGTAAYEAIVFIGWDPVLKKYSCLWLDVTGSNGIAANAIGHAEKVGDSLPFNFKIGDGNSWLTTFIYDRKSDKWNWEMDMDTNGQTNSFARVILQRK